MIFEQKSNEEFNNNFSYCMAMRMNPSSMLKNVSIFSCFRVVYISIGSFTFYDFLVDNTVNSEKMTHM